MKTRNLSATLLAFGLLLAAPAFAQTTPVQKQKTQEGGPSMPMANDPNFKQRTQEGGGPSMPMANDPNFKQRTQEGGGPSMPMANDPNFKQRTQNLSPSSAQADSMKQK